MTKRLLIVFFSGLVLALALLSTAWLAAGDRFTSDIRKQGSWTFLSDDDDKGPRVTRTLDYDGTRPLVIEAPVNLRFQRGSDARMTVEGSQSMMDALRWKDGRLYLEGSHVMRHALKVTVVAPQLPGITLQGAGKVELEGLDQPALAIELRGAGDIDANGKVARLDVTVRGAGDVDLARLEAIDATVHASGVGNIDISATGKVDLVVSGAGTVGLHRKPSQLTSRVSGVGSVNHDY